MVRLIEWLQTIKFGKVKGFLFFFLVPMHTFANYNANEIMKTVDEANIEEEETTPPINSHIGVRVFLESIFNF